MKIAEFNGGYRWLSNFAPAWVNWSGDQYKTTEHAYQAAKFSCPEVRRKIREQVTPGRSKREARRHTPDSDFPDRKLAVMLELQRQKYSLPYYRALLLATGSAEIIEGNTWGDTFWGVCKGTGENHLGKLIMQVRDEIRLGVL